MIRSTSLFVLFLAIWMIPLPTMEKSGQHHAEPSLFELVQNALKAKERKPWPKDERHLLGEVLALEKALDAYDLETPGPTTDGWSDFIQAEWPFMALAYSGMALTRLPERLPQQRQRCAERVRWILKAMRQPGIRNFVVDHFGEPFPERGSPSSMSVFFHGHYFYLAMLAEEHLGVVTPGIDEIRDGFIRDYKKAWILPSYHSMYYSSDNGSALAALAIYDRLRGKNDSRPIRQRFIKNIQKHYLDEDSGLVVTYLDPDHQKTVGGPRGTGTMYLGLYLPKIDTKFAKDQWKKARRTMVQPMNLLLLEQQNLPTWAQGLAMGSLPKAWICMERPSTVSWAERQWGDQDSGPVILGVGTSASAFMMITASRMGEHDIADSTIGLAHHMAVYRWIDDQYVATSAFHEVGQAIIFLGKVEHLISSAASLSHSPSMTY